MGRSRPNFSPKVEPIEGSHLTSQVQGSQHMLGGKLSVAGGLGTFTLMFVLCNFAQL